MPSLRNARLKSSKAQPPAPNRNESAQYTYDMLISLKKIAALRKEAQLMRLIEAAAEEARALSESR
jgi:hypothetical protein